MPGAVAVVNGLAVAALTVLVLAGGPASRHLAVALAAGGLAAAATAGPAGAAARVRRWAVGVGLTGMPVAVATGLVVASRTHAGGGPGSALVAAAIVLAAAAGAGAGGTLVRAGVDRRRRPAPATAPPGDPPPPETDVDAPGPAREMTAAAAAAAAPGRRRRRRWALAGATAALLAVVPGAADVALERDLVAEARACPPMADVVGRVDRWTMEALAAGCRVWSGTAPVPRRAGGSSLTVDAYGPSAPAVAEQAASAAAHFEALLGRPAVDSVAVLPVPLGGAVRGMAGRGYVLVDEGELDDPAGCRAFRRTAGVGGTCGTWVVAHEVAHQWFRWSSFADAGAAYPALWEGTADYLAFSWWREANGEADAAALAGELFGGRIGLAPGFAASHAPAAAPTGMSDAQGRALVYGRSSAAWLAVERAAGRDVARRVLAAVYEAGRRSSDVGLALEAAAAADDGAGGVLEQWWTAVPFAVDSADWRRPG